MTEAQEAIEPRPNDDAVEVSPEVSGPITSSDRIVSLDVLRGVGVLGILVMNIQAFAMIGAAYMNPTAAGANQMTGVNLWVWYLSHVFADQKFMTIFSMLFGAGIIVMTSRRESTGRKATGLHYRRMGWLLLLGMLHAYLLWYGDILVTYAICGMVAYLFRKLPPRLLLALGLLLVAVASAAFLSSGFSMPVWREGAVAELRDDSWTPLPKAVEQELADYRGGWLDQMGHRVPAAIAFQTFVFLIWTGWRAGGMMLIGMALYKLGVFSATRSRAFYLGLVAVGAFVGIPAIIYGVHRNFAAHWDIKYSLFLGGQYNYWASILVALGWVGLVMLACRAAVVGALTRCLGAVGRMALTNYLLQTLICTSIFYGHGLGLFGSFNRVQQILTVVAVWAVALVLSPLWLRFFRFGPFEWLWRSLTYQQIQPILRTVSSAP